MILALSIGNSLLRIGAMEGERVLAEVSASTRTDRSADEYACLLRSLLALRGIDPKDADGAIVASVVPPVTERITRALTELVGKPPRLLGCGMKTGLNIRIEDPGQLGGDLVASAVGAAAGYPLPLLVIDADVATTFSVLGADGAFLGCAIAPGVAVSADALARAASLLPSVASGAPTRAIGTTTAESLRSGSLYGTAAMIDGMIDRMEAELGMPFASIVASGEARPDLLSHCRHTIAYDPTLALRGLARIYHKNIKYKNK